MDWTDWHQRYDTVPALVRRLRIVREQIVAFLEERPAGPIKIVSLCAGDGRDVLEALRSHPRLPDVTAWMLDTHDESLSRGAKAAEEAGLRGQFRFICADATRTASYHGMTPADLVLLSGFLGHVVLGSIPYLIKSLPMMCRRGGSVIWNRHLLADGGAIQVEAIRGMLKEASFVEQHFETTDVEGFAVGRSRFTGQNIPLDPSQVIFQFAS